MPLDLVTLGSYTAYDGPWTYTADNNGGAASQVVQVAPVLSGFLLVLDTPGSLDRRYELNSFDVRTLIRAVNGLEVSASGYGFLCNGDNGVLDQFPPLLQLSLLIATNNATPEPLTIGSVSLPLSTASLPLAGSSYDSVQTLLGGFGAAFAGDNYELESFGVSQCGASFNASKAPTSVESYAGAPIMQDDDDAVAQGSVELATLAWDSTYYGNTIQVQSVTLSNDDLVNGTTQALVFKTNVQKVICGWSAFSLGWTDLEWEVCAVGLQFVAPSITGNTVTIGAQATMYGYNPTADLPPPLDNASAVAVIIALCDPS